MRVHLHFGRRPGQSATIRAYDLGLHVIGTVLVLLGLIDLCLGAFIIGACGIVVGIVVGCVPALVFDPDPIRDIYLGLDLDEDDIPPGPEGAAVVHSDGTRTALEMVFIGWDSQGVAMFRATMPVNLAAGDEIVMDKLPPNTGIVAGWYGT